MKHFDRFKTSFVESGIRKKECESAENQRVQRPKSQKLNDE
jgi:hypothetical protein